MSTSEINVLLKQLIRLSEEENIALKNNIVSPVSPTTTSLVSLSYNIVDQTSVTIPHNLNRWVVVMVFDNSGNRVDTNENQNDKNNLLLTFNPAFTGKAIIY